jgi:hypothetical protein
VALQPYQVSYNGLTFGPGTDVQLQGITGIRSLPPMRTGDQARARVDGYTPGQNLLDERIITLSFLVSVTSGSWETALANLAAAFTPFGDPSTVNLSFAQWLATPSQPGMLQFQLPGWTYPIAAFGRPTKYDLPIDTDYQYHYARVAVEMTCPDGVLYENSLIQSTTGLPSPTAGLTFPVTFPASFGASTGGSVQVTNSGNYPTFPVITIQGPCTNPVVSLGSLQLGVAISLGSTDSLVIDMRGGSVTLDGTGLRNNLLTSGFTFFPLPAGTSTVGFSSSDATQVTGTMTVALLPAFAAV